MVDNSSNFTNIYSKNESGFRSVSKNLDLNLEENLVKNSVTMDKNHDSPSLFIPDDIIDNCVDEWKFSLIGRLDLVKLKFDAA